MANCTCGKKAAVFLRYAGKHLCKKCFSALFEKRVKKAIKELYPLKKGEKIAVALSGGKDSSVLLYVLKTLPLPPLKLTAITIDEGIEGYRKKSIEKARELTESLGIEHHIYSYKEIAGMELDEIVVNFKDEPPCSHCGVLRRAILQKAAKELKADALATGHNLDDAVQSFLLNIMKNDVKRISKLVKQESGEGFVKRIKPLIYCPEKEVALYSLIKNLPIDSADCPYAYLSMRAAIREMINELEERYPGVKFRIFKSMQQIERKDEREMKRCSCSMPTSGEKCMFCKKIEQIKEKQILKK